MAPPADLRAWIAVLEREGELVRIAAEVDPELEITEITDRTVKAGGPALLFENVKGSRHSTMSPPSSATCWRCSRPPGSSTRCAACRS